MRLLLDRISSKVKLTPELEAQIEDIFTREEIPKNHYLLREGQFSDKLYFLEKGVVRSFYYHDAKEATSWLYVENQFVTSWYSFLGQTQGFEYLETLETCTVYWVKRTQYEQLLSSNPSLEKFGRTLMEDQLAFLDYFYKGFLFMTAKEKYDLLLSVFPDVTQRVNLGHIASLLGISQETLSRIRSRK